MANNVTNYICINGSDEVVNAIDARFEQAGGYAETAKFVNAFYDTDFDQAVKHDWMFDHVGTKWIYIDNQIDAGEWNVQSASYCPSDFLVHLYKLAVAIDPNVAIEVKFQDESYEPVGAFLAKKDENGNPVWAINEEYDLEDPTADMDWDDEEYDDVQMRFMEEIDDTQNACLRFCHKTISNGDANEIKL